VYKTDSIIAIPVLRLMYLFFL